MQSASDRAATVMVLGAGRAIVKSIEALKRSGFRVIVIDDLPRPFAFEVADAGFRCALGDIDGLERLLDQVGPVDGAIATNEAGVLSIAVLADRGRFRGMPQSVAMRLASKLQQREEINRRCPAWSVPYHVVRTVDQVIAAGKDLGWPLILKPEISGGGSRGVSLVAGPASAAEALFFALTEARESMVLAERALDGPQFSAEVLVADGRAEVICIGRKRKSRAPYRVDLAVIYPSGLTGKLRAQAEQMLRDVVQAVGITASLSHVEFALTTEGPRPIEIGGRMGGGLTSLLVAHSSGCDPFVQAARAACGMPVQWPDRSMPERGAVYGFLSYQPGPVVDCSIPSSILQDSRILDVFMILPADRVIKPLQWTSQRVGMMGVAGETAADALTYFDKVSLQLKVKYADGQERSALTDNAE